MTFHLLFLLLISFTINLSLEGACVVHVRTQQHQVTLMQALQEILKHHTYLVSVTQKYTTAQSTVNATIANPEVKNNQVVTYILNSYYHQIDKISSATKRLIAFEQKLQQSNASFSVSTIKLLDAKQWMDQFKYNDSEFRHPSTWYLDEKLALAGLFQYWQFPQFLESLRSFDCYPLLVMRMADLAEQDKNFAQHVQTFRTPDGQSVLTYIQQELNAVRAEAWIPFFEHKYPERGRFGTWKPEHRQDLYLQPHFYCYGSFVAFLKQQPTFEKQIFDLYQKLEIGDPHLTDALNTMPAGSKGAIFGFIGVAYHTLTGYAMCVGNIARRGIELLIQVLRALNPLPIGHATYASAVSAMSATGSVAAPTPYYTLYSRYQNATPAERNNDKVVFVTSKNESTQETDITDVHTMPYRNEYTYSEYPSHAAEPTPQVTVVAPETPTSRRHQLPDHVQKFQREAEIARLTRQHNALAHDMVPLSRLNIQSLHRNDIRSLLKYYYGVYPEQFTLEQRNSIFLHFSLYACPEFVNTLRSMAHSNWHFCNVALQTTNWPEPLKAQLAGLTVHDWAQVIESARKISITHPSNDVLLRGFACYVPFYQFKNFKECLRQFPQYQYALIDMAFDALHDADAQAALAHSVDCDAGTVLKYVQHHLHTASEATFKGYFEWKYPERGPLDTWSYEQKCKLFSNASLWHNYGYISMLTSTKDFDHFALQAQHDPAFLQKARRYNSLEGRGTVADHVQSLAQGALESYRAHVDTYAWYNGPYGRAMSTLTSRERYHFYKDPVFYMHPEFVHHLASYGHEYDENIQRLAHDLTHDTALATKFAGKTAHNGTSIIDYVRHEATQAYQREEYRLHQATYDLAQRTDFLQQTKTELLEQQQLSSLPFTQQRLQERIDVVDQFLNGNHTISHRTYTLTMQGKNLARSLNMHEYDLLHCHGNIIQHQIHGELVTLINEGGTFINMATGKQLSSDQLGMLLGEFAGYMGEYASIAHDYNKTVQHIEKAWTVSDVCWGFVDCCYAAIQGVGDGILATANNIKTIAYDPIEAAKRCAESTGALAGNILKALYAAESLHADFEFSVELGEERARDIAKNITAIGDALYAEIKDLPPRDIVRGLAAMATETYLGDKTKALSLKFFNSAKDKAARFAKKIGTKLTNKSPILKTTEGLHVRVADKATKYHHNKSANKKSCSHGGAKGNGGSAVSKQLPTYNYKNGKYNGVKYHHANSKGPQGSGGKGIKSPAPTDGQAALDNSIEIFNDGYKSRRIGISNGEYVVLDGTSQQGFHGHIRTLEDMKKLSSWNSVKKKFLEAGIIDKSGNIL